jgi:NhaP-type Na+/H+ or K+/H+ antiporter
VCRLCKYKSGIRFKDLVFISYAGLIRGAVAFGLVLRIDHEIENRRVIITTALALVVFTTVFLGSTVATASKCLFGKEIEEKKRLERERQGRMNDPIELDGSHHEVLLHPNEES